MREVNRHALVAYTPGQMFALVDDIVSYPQFLRWCAEAEEHLRSDEQVEASLVVQQGPIRRRFRTRNLLTRDQAIDMTLIDGPFRQLEGRWQFEAVGEAGCKVSLHLAFSFDSAVTDRLFGRFFEASCNSLVDAFTRRADELYGDSPHA